MARTHYAIRIIREFDTTTGEPQVTGVECSCGICLHGRDSEQRMAWHTEVANCPLTARWTRSAASP